MASRAYLLFRSIIAYILLVIVASVFFVPCLLLIVVIPARYRVNNRLIAWLLYASYWGALRSLLVPIHITKSAQIPQEPAIFVANHQSALDIPVMGVIGGTRPHIWFVLDYYLRTPILGFFIKRMAIPVSRENSAQDARGVIIALRALTHYQCNILIFPEGKRSTDGTVHEFLGGFALLARKSKSPVVPVYIKNTAAVLMPETFILHTITPIEVIVGPRYYYNDNETDEQFSARVHDWFIQESLHLSTSSR